MPLVQFGVSLVLVGQENNGFGSPVVAAAACSPLVLEHKGLHEEVQLALDSRLYLAVVYSCWAGLWEGRPGWVEVP